MKDIIDTIEYWELFNTVNGTVHYTNFVPHYWCIEMMKEEDPYVYDVTRVEVWVCSDRWVKVSDTVVNKKLDDMVYNHLLNCYCY